MSQHRIPQYLTISYKHAEVLFCMFFMCNRLHNFLITFLPQKEATYSLFLYLCNISSYLDKHS